MIRNQAMFIEITEYHGVYTARLRDSRSYENSYGDPFVVAKATGRDEKEALEALTQGVRAD